MNKIMTIKQTAAIAFFALSGFTATPSMAQQPGEVRAQGRVIGDPPVLPGLGAPAPILDLREELRTTIERAARYARQQSPRFIVTVMDGAALVSKPQILDETVLAPARAFQRSIDGLFQQGLFVGVPTFNEPREKEAQEQLVRELDFARAANLPIFSIDYTNKPDLVTKALQEAAKEKVVSFVSNQPRGRQNELPRIPRRPPYENGNSVLTLEEVKNFVVIRDSSGFGHEDNYAFKMKDTNYDLVVTSVFHGRAPLSKRAVETLKYKKLGARRLVFALMDIGSAAAYHYYWKDDWREGFPEFITVPYPTDPDRYFVQYWDPVWQQVMFGNTGSYLYGIIQQGFDGVIIEGGDAYLYFENPDQVLEQLQQAHEETTPAANERP